MDLLDQLLNELDQCWLTHPEGNDCVFQLLDKLPDEAAQREEAVTELCAADLEWRWRTSKRSGKSVSHPPSQTTNLGRLGTYGCKRANQSLPRTPSAKDYLSIPGVSDCSVASMQELYFVEWQLCHRYREEPSVTEYIALWPEDDRWHDRLRNSLNQMAKLFVLVTQDGMNCFRQELPQSICVGRQKLGDPSAPAWIERERRLVLAKVEQTNFSRKQFQIDRISVAAIRLVNCSDSLSIPVARQSLVPGASLELKLPTKISFDNVCATLYSEAAVGKVLE